MNSHDYGYTILELKHGSFLYGTNHADSDIDIYRITEKGAKIFHRIESGIDITIIPLSKFLKNAEKGAPQALEAMFAEDADIDLFSNFRRQYRARGAQIFDTFDRTIKNFERSEKPKHKAHAFRFKQYLKDLEERGRFNPRLNDEQIRIFHEIRKPA